MNQNRIVDVYTPYSNTLILEEEMKPYLHTITILVSDLAKSIAFYRLLGLHVPDCNENETHVDCTSEGSSCLCLVPYSTVQQHYPQWQHKAANNMITLQFRCHNQGEVDIIYTKLINHEYISTQTPYNTPWGERYAQVFDPDGNTIALFAPL